MAEQDKELTDTILAIISYATYKALGIEDLYTTPAESYDEGGMTFSLDEVNEIISVARPIIEKQERANIADQIVNECDEIRDPVTNKITYYGITPEIIKALKGTG